MVDERPGFSLIELMMSIVIIGMLITLLIEGFDPFAEFGATNNATRKQDVGKIAHALSEYTLDEGTDILNMIPLAPSSAIEVCADLVTGSCANLLNVHVLGQKNYTDSIPIDPLLEEDPDANDEHSGYYVVRPSTNRFTVTAPLTEQGDPIISTSM